MRNGRNTVRSTDGMIDALVEKALIKKYGSAERAEIICQAFPDVNPEAIARAILSYSGNYPPYPQDIEVKVYQLDIDGVWMKAIRRSANRTKEEQLKRIRERLKEEL